MNASCYLYDSSNPFSWGDCCDELGIEPKPIWLVLALSLPIEFYLAAADVKATHEMYEKQAFWGAFGLLLYNLATVLAIGFEFNTESCGTSLVDRFECYQGVLFVFYNSTAALAAMTVWTLAAMRKYYWHLYYITRAGVQECRLWRCFDESNESYGGTEAVVKRWHEIGRETEVYWYNKVAIRVMFLAGGASHVLPMILMYSPLFFAFCAAMIYCHCFRLGYAPGTTNLKSALVTTLMYPLVVLFFIPATLFSYIGMICQCTSLKESTNKQLPSQENESDPTAEMLNILVVSSQFTRWVSIRQDSTVHSFLDAVRETFPEERSPHLRLMNEDTLLDKLNWTLADYRIRSTDVIHLVSKLAPDCWCSRCLCCCSFCKSTKKGTEIIIVRRDTNQGIDPLDFVDFSSGEETAGTARETIQVHGKHRYSKTVLLGNYVRDFLRSLCLFDASGKVIIFAGATTFLMFTISFNYGVLFYSGASYLEVIEIEWNARRYDKWYSCTFEGFPRSYFTLVDCFGLLVSASLALLDFCKGYVLPVQSQP